MLKFVSRAVPLATAGLLAAVCAATPAFADEEDPSSATRGTNACEPTFMSSGAEFGLESDGSIDDSESFDHSDDTWDDAAELNWRISGSEDPSFESYDAPSGCTTEESGREIVYGEEEIAEGLFVSRKTYVPSEGAFARTVDAVVNRSDVAQTLDLAIETDHYSDEDAGIGASSSGDLSTTPDDFWFTQIDTDGAGGEYDSSHATNNFQSVRSLDRADEILGDMPSSGVRGSYDDTRVVVFRSITVQPGETARYMTAYGQGNTVSDANDLAASLAGAPDELFAGMSAAETDSVRNWTRDSDGDGHLNENDNCADVANADQANMDGDAQGDLCDDDIDGDGLPNAIEEGLRTNMRLADTDGDGKIDGTDRCPTLAGATADGCPAAVTVLQASTGRGLPTGVTLNVRVTRGAGASASRARAAQSGGLRVRSSGVVQLPRGMSNAACAGGRIAVVIKQNKRTISTRVLNVRSDCTYRSTVTFRRKLGRSSLRVKSYFFGSQGLHGRAAKSKLARLS